MRSPLHLGHSFLRSVAKTVQAVEKVDVGPVGSPKEVLNT
jgi:hypothetical protein